MTEATMNGMAESPRVAARLGGLFWLITFVTGMYAMLSYQSIVISGDVARTVANLVANESSFRLAIVANVIASISYIGAALYVYFVLKPVDEKASLLAALFGIGGSIIGCVTFGLELAPISVLRLAEGNAFTAEQTQILAVMFLRAAVFVERMAFLMFGLHVLLVGVLILRSTFVSRVVGALMLFGGIGWLVYALSNLLAPDLAKAMFPLIMLPGTIGEASLTLWLLIKGVNVERWFEQSRRRQIVNLSSSTLKAF